MASGVGLMHQRQHARRRGVSWTAGEVDVVHTQLYSREVGVGCLKFVRQEGEVMEGGKYELCVVCRCVLRIEGRSWQAGWLVLSPHQPYLTQPTHAWDAEVSVLAHLAA